MSSFDVAMSMYKREDYVGALEIFSRLAKENIQEAKLWLGIMKLWGEGTPVDREMGLELLKEVAPTFEEAQFHIDIDEEIKELREKADAGDSDAQFEIASELYDNPVSLVYERRLLESAADNGHEMAQEWLANFGERRWIEALARRGGEQNSYRRYLNAILYLEKEEKCKEEWAIFELKSLAKDRFHLAQKKLAELEIYLEL